LENSGLSELDRWVGQRISDLPTIILSFQEKKKYRISLCTGQSFPMPKIPVQKLAGQISGSYTIILT
jgi:hypothetical protein